MAAYPWDVLGIEPTDDEALIRRAYARLLRQTRPDEDPTGFQRLVAAREAALAWRPPPPGDNDDEDGYDEFSDFDENDQEQDERTSNDDDDGEPDPEAYASPEDETPEPVAVPDPVPVKPPETGGPSVNLLAPPVLTVLPPPSQTAEPAPPPVQQPDMFSRATALLNELLGYRRSNRTQPVSEVRERWADLLALADLLSFRERESLVDLIAGRLLARLEPPKPNDLGGYDFERGKGMASVIALLEAELDLSADQQRLGRLAGTKAVHIYMTWVVELQKTAALRKRLAAGRKAYRTPRGAPLIPPEDIDLVLPDPQARAQVTRMVESGRRLWPLRKGALLFPGAHFAALGFPVIGILVTFGTGIALIQGGADGLDAFITTAVIVAGILVLRMLAAIALPQIGIAAALGRVRAADRQNLTGGEARRSFVARPYPERLATFLRGLEITVALVAVMLLFGGSEAARRDVEVLNRPGEEVWSSLVVDALAKVAVADGLASDEAMNFFAELAGARTLIFPGASGSTTDGRGIDPTALERMRRRLGSLPATQPPLAARSMARQAKLIRIMQDYRAAAPAARRRIEDDLAAWRPVFALALTPFEEAAAWDAVPPRGRGRFLSAYPAAARRIAVDRLLRDAAATPNAVSVAERFATLHRLLKAPDDAWLTVQPAFFNYGPGWSRLEGALAFSKPVQAYFQEVIGRDMPAVHLAEPNAWFSHDLAQQAFLDTAALCLRATENAAHEAVVRVLIETVTSLPARIEPAVATFWRERTAALTADPACFHQVAGRVGAATGERSSTNRAFKAVFDRAYAASDAGRSDEARQLYSEFIDLPFPASDVPARPEEVVNWLPLAYSNRASGLLDAGRPLAALADADEAVLLSPNSYYANINRGLALGMLGEDERALADYNRAEATRPATDMQLYALRGRLLLRMKRYDKAIADLSRMIGGDDKGNALYLMLRAEAYREIGRDLDARRDERRASELDPASVGAQPAPP